MNVLAAVLVASTSLHITVWPNGEGEAHRWAHTLRCAPSGGTLPHPGTACTKLAGQAHPFAPTPKGTACTMIYGGPQEALVAGRFRGKLIHARFDRKNGCELGRWIRVRFLFTQ